MSDKLIILRMGGVLDRFGTYVGPYEINGKQYEDFHRVWLTEELTPKGKRKKYNEPHYYLAHEKDIVYE